MAPVADVVAAMFETATAAMTARDALCAAGFAAHHITLVHSTDVPVIHPAVPSGHVRGYADAVAQGHALLFVDADPAHQDRIMALLDAAHPLDMMVRNADWAVDPPGHRVTGTARVRRYRAADDPEAMPTDDA